APGERAAILKALATWMEDEELLQVKRRHADRTSWEPKVGAFASIQRALGTKGKTYALARAAEVAGQVTQLEPGFCHVQLVANVANLRKVRLSGAGAIAALAAAAVALGATVPIALITRSCSSPARCSGAPGSSWPGATAPRTSGSRWRSSRCSTGSSGAKSDPSTRCPARAPAHWCASPRSC